MYVTTQIAPAELEAIIAGIPEVKDVIVIPVLDDEAGELPRAYVVLQDNTSITAEKIHAHVDAKVAPHKRLRGGIKFVSSVPKSASGKLLRRVQVEMDRKESKTNN